jgi:hypothetical protein
MQYMVILAMILVGFKARPYGIRIAAIVWFITVYVFFSLAATKMVSFCSIVSSVVFVGFGYMVASITEWIKLHVPHTKLFTAITLPVLGIICWLFLNLNDIANHHTSKAAIGRNRKHLSKEQVAYLQNLQGKLPKRSVLFTDWLFGHVPIMFFTDYTAYWYLPSDQVIDSLLSKDYSIAILADSVPDRLKQNKRIQLLDAPKTKAE